jgi:hypothetical protein
MFFVVYLIGDFYYGKGRTNVSILFQNTKTGSRSFEIGGRMILSATP